MTTKLPISGIRVRLISTTDPYTKLRPQALGTALSLDSNGTLHMIWDDGSNLGLIEGIDVWEYIDTPI